MLVDYTNKRRSYRFQAQNNWVHGFWRMYDDAKRADPDYRDGNNCGAEH